MLRYFTLTVFNNHILETSHRARSAAEGSASSAEPKEPVEEAPQKIQVQSIFLLAAAWLLDHKALKVSGKQQLSSEIVRSNFKSASLEA